MSDRIYLDHNATTPVDERVLEKILPYFTDIYGNAASNDHDYGYEAKKGVDKAREKIARVIGAKPEEIIFTSGATESDNIALRGIAEKYADQGDHIITCKTEHKAVLDVCKKLEKMGKKITYLPVDQYGMVDPNDVEEAITPDTILISIMFANNEIGTIHPIKKIGKIAEENEVFFHTDAAQAVGHLPIDVEEMKINLMSMSGHKIYGPKGIGALYRKKSNPRVEIEPLIFGGGHERGIRSGTLNVPAIIGFGEAVKLGKKEMDKENKKYKQWSEYFLSKLRNQIGEVHLNGHPKNRLPNNLNISIPGVESRALIVKLKEIAVATGSACTSAKVEPSHVIKALGFGEQRAHNAIRISFGRGNTKEEIDQALDHLVKNINRLNALSIS
ncbi:cysteine desulfurase family protein [Fodinibius sp. AD559]|uniref:cysteine desulfurase family protein n=1 Tax=Fodinibius sp. AD559 TaxID=3424179 RepID=UPI00404703ED